MYCAYLTQHDNFFLLTGFSGGSARTVSSQNNQPQMNAIVGGPVKQKTSPLTVVSGLCSNNENSAVSSNKHFNSFSDPGVVQSHKNDTSSSFFPNSNSMTSSAIVDSGVSLQVSGSTSAQLNAPSMNNFISTSPTNISKNRHSSGQFSAT